MNEMEAYLREIEMFREEKLLKAKNANRQCNFSNVLGKNYNFTQLSF